MFRLLLTLFFVIFSHQLYSDDHKEKGKEREMKKMKESLGYWKAEDCKKISEAAGLFIYFSYELLEESDKLKQQGKELESDKIAEGGVALSQVAANYANTFEAFCKR